MSQGLSYDHLVPWYGTSSEEILIRKEVLFEIARRKLLKTNNEKVF